MLGVIDGERGFGCGSRGAAAARGRAKECSRPPQLVWVAARCPDELATAATWDLGTTTTSGTICFKVTRCRSSAARHRQLGIRLVHQPTTFPSTLSSRHQPTTNESIKRTNEYCIVLNSEIFTRCLALLFKMTLMLLWLMWLMWLMWLEEAVVVDKPSISSISRFLREIETSDPLLIPIECCVELHVDVRCVS